MTVMGSEKLRLGVRIGVPVLLAVSAVLCSLFAQDGRKYAVVTVIVALLCVLLFWAGFDKRRIGSRRLVLGAVFTALAVAGRFIPLLKPVTAMTVIGGMYLGAETGALIGSVSMLVSNLWFGNGPWTPVQMATMGLLGFFSGLFGKFIQKNRITLSLYGIASGVFYSMFMDIWTISSTAGTSYIDAVRDALPITATYAIANVIYLNLLQPPFGAKLSRIKNKYGL